MSKLTKLLEYGFAGSAERKRMLNQASFKHEVGEETYKTLLQSDKDAISDSTLVQEEVYKTIIAGAEPVRCMREITPVIKTDSYSIRVVKGQVGTYADEIAEGQKIPIDIQNYSKKDITISKYGTRPLITNELIEDSLFDIVELELKKAGARLENKLNRVILNEILSNVDTTCLPSGSHIAVSDIARAVGKVKKNNFIPNVLVTHPTAEAYLLSDSNLAYVAYAGSAVPLTQGKIPTKIMGLTPYTCTVTDKDTNPVWNDTTPSSNVVALVLSKEDLGLLAMRRDITVEQYEDPIHDLVGISATMRFGYGVINEDAACAIYHR